MGIKRIDHGMTFLKREKSFPKLMKHVEIGSLASFIDESLGTMLYCGVESNSSVGAHLTRVLPEMWEDYNEPFSIQNSKENTYA